MRSASVWPKVGMSGAERRVRQEQSGRAVCVVEGEAVDLDGAAARADAPVVAGLEVRHLARIREHVGNDIHERRVAKVTVRGGPHVDLRQQVVAELVQVHVLARERGAVGGARGEDKVVGHVLISRGHGILRSRGKSPDLVEVDAIQAEHRRRVKRVRQVAKRVQPLAELCAEAGPACSKSRSRRANELVGDDAIPASEGGERDHRERQRL